MTKEETERVIQKSGFVPKGFSQGFVTGVCPVSRKRLRYNWVF